ncbi:ferredoxin [Vannielia litorea]|uniref:4Fe-4S ferredoxin-type domain-containing protein n=1 Tax=Vannielia litorea TaxID=1217970 RepID=A0A1N6IBN8_9RHOB|nr:ferredoxin [Vannielia litorea]SIO29436.1 hypothetical protein SAMN05444002_3667 [Vannielia litorea]
MRLEAAREACAAEHLDIAGGLHEAGRTILLLSPREPGFWAALQAAPEWSGPDPVDTWSRRVVGGLAEHLGGVPLFPFDGPPWLPFQSWALATGRAWQSPVRLLVGADQGLWVSFRGALAFDGLHPLPEPTASPCPGCNAPCTTACPVGALTEAGYDTARCHAYLDTPEGADCLTRGCRVRRACPVSATFPRVEAQSAFHMSHFHRTGTN